VIRSGEFDWIAKYFAPLAGTGSFGLKDDAALLDLKGAADIVVTQDAILEGVHFLPDYQAEQVARKALRVNVSDIVAKGARPFSYSLSLGVPDIWSDMHVENFAKGLGIDQHCFGISLSGGDTYRSPERLCVSITMFGALERTDGEGRYVSRAGAKPGDNLVIVGAVGDAALGLLIAKGEKSFGVVDDMLARRYHWPDINHDICEPIARYASASMDISDGLIGDCRKLCSASCLSARIDREKIPLTKEVEVVLNDAPALWSVVLGGGDDYCVLCCVGDGDWQKFSKLCEKFGSVATRIGKIEDNSRSDVSIYVDGVPSYVEHESYSHF